MRKPRPGDGGAWTQLRLRVPQALDSQGHTAGKQQGQLEPGESRTLSRPEFCCSVSPDLCKVGLLAGESNEAVVQCGLALNQPRINAYIGGRGINLEWVGKNFMCIASTYV